MKVYVSAVTLVFGIYVMAENSVVGVLWVIALLLPDVTALQSYSKK